MPHPTRYHFRRDVKSQLRGFWWSMGEYPSLVLGASLAIHGQSFVCSAKLANPSG